MRIIGYLKKNGIKRAIQVLYEYKIEFILEKIINIFTKMKPLQNKIIIESHDDFDCNGGAFYEYLVRNNYNKKYRIIWLVRRKVEKELPENVEWVWLYKPSIKKAYHVCTAKYCVFDCENPNKTRRDQIMVYCSHGAGGLKNAKGKVNIPDYVDYILMQSPQYAPIQADQWSLQWPNPKCVYIGYPAHDTFFDSNKDEMCKITHQKYAKVILWMPTFRKGGGFNRNDSNKEQKLGIPLIESYDEYSYLNQKLKEADVFLIIKIHPKQDILSCKISDMSNIKVLTPTFVKTSMIDNYRLMKCTDALLSDYSSVAYEYLQLNNPIGYIFDDIKEYKLGTVVENINEFIAGKKIYTLQELLDFIFDIVKENDVYREQRKVLREKIYQYHDGNSSQRLAKLLGLNLEDEI